MQDAIFILDTLIDTAKIEEKKLFVVFIDFQKAYDFVYRDGLFFKLLQSGLTGKVFNVLHSMYQSVQSVERWGGEISEVIEQSVGLRQGCVLSPSLPLFFIYCRSSELPSRQQLKRS